MKIALGLVLLVLASASLFDSRTARASTAIEVISQQASNRFPDGIAFNIILRSPGEVTSARLNYRISGENAPGSSRGTCSGTGTVTCTLTIRHEGSGLHVGADVQYTWEIEVGGGEKLSVPQATTNYTDSRFRWDSIAEGGLTVFYYGGEEANNRRAFQAARETIDRFSKLEGVTVGFPIKIFIYQTTADLQPAARGSRGHNVSLGVKVSDDTVLVSRQSSFLDIVRHEIAHVVTEQARKGKLGQIPAWMDEGLSTLAQGADVGGRDAAVAQAIRTNRTLPITALTPRDGALTDLFYGQSAAIVGYLIQRDGEAKFAEFLANFRDEQVEGALKKTYGIDLLGLENEWRKSVGLPPVDTSAPATSSQSAEPTRTPLGASSSSSSVTPTPAAANNQSRNNDTNNQPANQPRPANRNVDDGGGSSDLLIVMAIVALGALFAGGAGVYLARKSAKE